jgi:hypothetical protein
MLIQALVLVVLLAIGVCKIWYFINMNDASNGAGKEQGE